MKKSLLFFFLSLSGTSFIVAQTIKNTEDINQLWFGYFNQTRFSNKWGMWADIHLRTKEKFVKNVSQGVLRLGVTWYVNDATKITMGYAFFNHFATEGHEKISQPEHRPWQQVQWQSKYGKKTMIQRIRLEERYRRKILNDSTLAMGYNFNFRMRYQIAYEIPISKNGSTPYSWSFVVNDEVLINFGKEIINNYFDQNRLFLGLKYQVNEHNNVQVGYMNLFQQLGAGNKYRNINAIRVFYFQNLTL